MGFLKQIFSRKYTKENLVADVMAALVKAGKTDLEYDETNFLLRDSNGRQYYLANLWNNCRNAGEELRRAHIDESVGSFLEIRSIPDSYELVKPQLMAVIRDPAYGSLMRLASQTEGNDKPGFAHVSQPLTEGLVVGLVYDTEHSLMLINQQKLQQWGVNLDEALKAGKENLRERTDPRGFMEKIPGIFVSGWGDSYDAARMLLPEFIYRLSINGDPVAFAPTRNQLWITGSEDRAGLEHILKEGKESHLNGGHALSPNLYRLQDSRWLPFVPEDATLRELWRSIKMQREAIDYEEQKKYLEAIYTKSNIDIFVASYSLFERSDGSLFSVCTWTKGADSVLPRAEELMFVIDAANKDLLRVSWEQAIGLVGNLMEEEADLVPVRYRVRTFPNDVQIEQLRALARSEKS